MVFASPGVQESTENQKEIAPGKHMPKKCENLGAESQKHENGSYDSGAASPREFTFSDLDLFGLHFGPEVTSRRHLGAKMMRKWTPGKPQGPQNHEKIMKSCMDF